MTERKPPEIQLYLSWVDQQIIDAEKRGVFDHLPGTGKPIPRTEETDYSQAWLRDYLRREGVPTEELLPAPLKLRKETERMAAAVPGLPSEPHVRAAAPHWRIMEWRRNSVGPPSSRPWWTRKKWSAARRARASRGAGFIPGGR